MKKLSIVLAFAAFSLATTTFAGDKDKACTKESKSCCKNGGAKACAKGAEAKSCHDKETKSSNEAAPKK